MTAPEKTKPVVLLISNSDTYCTVFDRQRRLKLQPYDCRVATVRPDAVAGLPDALTVLKKLKEEGKTVAAVVLHDKTLPLSYKDTPVFQDVWQSAVEDLETRRQKIHEDWREQVRDLKIELPSGIDAAERAIWESRFEAAKEIALGKQLDEVMQKLAEVKENANGILELLVPSDASLKFLKELRKPGNIPDAPIVIVGSYPDRDHEYRDAAGANIHIFDSSSADFVARGIEKLRELLPVKHTESIHRGGRPELN